MLEAPVLVGDIGGTNARFAILPEPGRPLIELPRTLVADHADPVGAIRCCLAQERVRSALLAVAAPIDSLVLPMTNAHWVVDATGIGEALGLSRVMLVNDFVPVATSLAVLSEAELAPIGPPRAGRGTRVVLGPGTGLGAAALVEAGERLVVLSTEAGHVDFGPVEGDEFALWPRIEPVGGRISAETILSGPGLLRLYRALASLPDAPAGRASGCEAPNEVMEAALAGTDDRAAAALDLFVRLLARYASDLAVAYGALGGVYIGGGIAPRMIHRLQEGPFRAAFERKSPHEAMMRSVPLSVITHPEPALLGLAAIASDPDRFVFHSRSWITA